MKFISIAVLVLLAGTIDAAIELTLNAGEEYTFNVFGDSTITLCSLTRPDGQSMDFVPGQTSTHGDRYELQPVTLPICSIKVSNLEVSDSGKWVVAAVGSGTQTETYSLTVISEEGDNVDAGDEVSGEVESENDGDENGVETAEVWKGEHVSWLSPIVHPTKIGHFIDISLSKLDHYEDCYVIKPGGDRIKVSEITIPNLTVHSSSNFVSCRITIGPINEALLGEWALCGVYSNDKEDTERCQQARIILNNDNHPESDWIVTTQPVYDHVVNIGGTLSPVVLGMGDVITCHIITPNGEDLVITEDTDYPNIKYVDSSDCIIDIGPIQDYMLGNWTIYGQFRNLVTGLNEERLPMYLFLYDQENPISQAYNVTVMDPVIHVVNLESTLNLDIIGIGAVDDCQFIPPSGQEYNLETQNNFEGASYKNEEPGICRLVIGPTTEKLLGTWIVIGKFSINGVFTERQQTVEIIKEDPENPVGHDRIIEDLGERYIESQIGNSHLLTIASNIFIEHESCHIVTPSGLQYKIMEGFNIPGVEVVESPDIECGVNITVRSDSVGEWILMARASRHSELIERRLHFTITVEVDNGSDITMSTINLVKGSSVEMYLGSETVTYCKLVDPQGVTVFNSFGRCKLSIDKVTLNHEGLWIMYVGYSGNVIAETTEVYVHVNNEENKPTIVTHVEKVNPHVTVSCSIETDAEVLGCKFRDPQGNLLLANGDYVEGRYTATSVNSNQRHTCSITITETKVSDLGIWRCSIDTTDGAYYAFLDVICPWAMQEPAVAATVQQEPLLAAAQSMVTGVEEDPITALCSIDAPIRYCYFRMANGTTITVNPGLDSSSVKYFGNGFESGECGLRFESLRHTDSGRWSCHVGLLNDPEEQRQQFQMTVHERMSATHRMVSDHIMMVEGQVYNARALEYCRFVRIDGFGFTSENVPAEYILNGILSNGECFLRINNPTILDMHPWTIVAKIQGEDIEIARDTMNSVLIGHEDEEPEGPIINIIYPRGRVNVFFLVIMSLALTGIIMGAMFGPKKNRQWARERAASIRSSFNRGQKTSNLGTQYA